MKSKTLILIVFALISLNTFAQCGVYRQQYKVASDAKGIELSRSVPNVVEMDSLLSLPLPKPFDRQQRNGVENYIYTAQAVYIGTKKEADGDYHLILQSKSGKPLDGEIPFKDCEMNSFILQNVIDVRATAETLQPGDLIEITFIPYYDKLHGSKGASPIGFEAHPIIKLIILQKHFKMIGN